MADEVLIYIYIYIHPIVGSIVCTLHPKNGRVWAKNIEKRSGAPRHFLHRQEEHPATVEDVGAPQVANKSGTPKMTEFSHV
jgi:hypothetical protein